MSDYTKTTWVTGDLITAERMNNIEEGIENIVNEINGTIGGGDGSGTLWDKIDDMIQVSPTQPSSSNNEIWFKSSESGNIQVPTYDEFKQLKDAIGNKSNLNTDTKTNLVSAINEVNGHFLDGIDVAIENWLDRHSEATTTVQDSSLTEAKFSDALKLKTIKDYITPEMFGAKGDGTTDDTSAFSQMIDYVQEEKIHSVFIPEGTYIINDEIVIDSYISLYGTPKTILKAGSQATNSLIKYTFANYENQQIIIDNIQLDGNNIATNGIFMNKTSGSPYLRNCIFRNIIEHDFTEHGFKFYCQQDNALYASVFYKCVFDSGISLNKFGDTVAIDGCSFGRLSDNEFIQYATATSFAFTNNNVTGYCVFNLQQTAKFSNNIFELQVEPTKDFITISHANSNTVMQYCCFSNQHRISDPTSIKLLKFTDMYLTFVGCLFTGNDAPNCYSASSSIACRFYGCMIGTGINNKDTVLANFNNRLFDICNGTYGAAPGFDALNANTFTAYKGISLNNYIRMEAVNTLPSTLTDNTLYIVRSEHRLCLSLTNGVVYQTPEMSIRA